MKFLIVSLVSFIAFFDVQAATERCEYRYLKCSASTDTITAKGEVFLDIIDLSRSEGVSNTEQLLYNLYFDDYLSDLSVACENKLNQACQIERTITEELKSSSLKYFLR